MKHLAGIEISSEQFAALCSLCSKDATFPKTWDEWQDLLSRAQLAAEQEGLAPIPVVIDLPQLTDWIRSTGFVPCLDAVRAYAIAKRSPGELGSAPIPPVSAPR